MRTGLVLVLACAACAARGGASANGPAAPSDPELAAIAHGWTIENHVITPRSDLAEADAAAWHGRHVAITATGYTTPFQGACQAATFTKRTRPLADISAEADLAGDTRLVPARFGLAAQVTEWKFVCGDRRDDGRLTLVPILTLFASGDRAMTCFGGVCYLLAKE